MVTVEDVHKNFLLGKNENWALRGINLTIMPGEFVALSGRSGSGKTTLLNHIGCLELPTRGKILINGIETSMLDDKSLARLRAKSIGYIFQTFNLLPVLTAVENVEYPLIRFKVDAETRRMKALNLLKMLGMENHADHRPDQLSGGQRQRVAIARALIHSPDLIVADEPTANLDESTSNGILDILKELNEKTQTTVIIASHDPLVLKRCTRVIELRDGKIMV